MDAQIRPVSLQELGESVNKMHLQEAYERGLQAGEELATKSAAGVLGEATERLEASREQALDNLSVDTVQLAVEIARQLVQVEIAAENYDLERIVRMSLAHSGLGRGSAVIHVSPEDHKRLESITFRSGTEVFPDSKLERGDVHVESPRGLLVREIDACLDTIREQLLEDIA